MQNATTPPMTMMGSYPAPRRTTQRTMANSASTTGSGATSTPPAAGLATRHLDPLPGTGAGLLVAAPGIVDALEAIVTE